MAAASALLSAPTEAMPVKTDRRLRIAYVVHDYDRYRGHSRYVVELATRFRAEHDVHVFTNTVDDSDTAGITFHRIRAWRRNALASCLSFIVPATLGVRGTFDIVHAQGLCGLRHNLATAHICQPAWFAGLAQEGVPLTWRQSAFKALVTGLEKRALTQPATRRVIAVSERLKADLARHYGRMDGVDVIYHGTDVSLFHPDNRERYRATIRGTVGLRRDQFVALYVGDLKRGAAAAIRAVAQTAGATLLIVSGSDVGPFRSLAEEQGAAERVIFHPHSRNVEQFFAAADAFLFPTVYDSFGLVITEAMAAGLPVITSRMAGAAELIADGANGLLTERAWDVPALVAHLERLRDDSGLRERLGQAARTRVEPLTWDRTADKTLAVYHRIATEAP